MGNRFQISFHMGTWGGLAAFAYFFLLWLTPYSPLGLGRFGGFWIPVLFVFLAVWKQMKAQREEGYSFREAFFTGMATALVLGFLKAVLVYMMIAFIDPGIISEYFNETISWLEWSRAFAPDGQKVDDQIELVREAMKKTTAFNTAASEINLYFMGALPVSLLAALIFNRKKNHEQSGT